MQIFADRADMHDSFDEWRNDVKNLENQLRRSGLIVKRAYVDPDTFPDWCSARGLKIDGKARAQFASEFAQKIFSDDE